MFAKEKNPPLSFCFLVFIIVIKIQLYIYIYKSDRLKNN